MWLAIFGWLFFREPLTRMVAIVGIAVGLVGVAILAGPPADVGGLDPVGLAALLVSPIAWALGLALRAPGARSCRRQPCSRAASR